MRVTDDRYGRELRRFDLAMRLIRHEARTHTVSAWTGFPAPRVRALYRSYPEQWARVNAVRRRGPSPRKVTLFLRAGIRTEAAAVGVLCSMLGAVPTESTAGARGAMSLTLGERLCTAFELYQAIIPEPRLTFERVLLLVNALATGEDLTLRHCANCDASILVDPLGKERHLCEPCREDSADAAGAAPAADLEPARVEPAFERQGSLF